MLQKLQKPFMLISAFLLAMLISFTVGNSRVHAAEPLSPSQFSDIPSGWSKEAVEDAINKGFLYGYNGEIRPKAYLTRSELASVTNRAFGPYQPADISHYMDVPANAWFYDDVSEAVSGRNMVGSGDLFFPYRDATREEVFAVLARAAGIPASNDFSSIESFSDYNQISPWAVGQLASMVEGGYMHGANGKLQPKTKITREEFAYVIYQFSLTPPSSVEQQVAPVPEPEPIPIPNENSEPAAPSLSAETVSLSKSQSSLRNQTINSDVVINEGVDGGVLTIDSVKLNGNLIINGGNLQQIDLSSGSSLDGIVISQLDGPLTINNNGTVSSLKINGGSDSVAFNGAVGAVDISSFNSSLTLKNSTVEMLSVTAEAIYSHFEVSNCTVATMNVDAAGPMIVVSDKSLVSSVFLTYNAAGASMTVQDSSKVAFVEVSSIDTSMELKSGSNIQRMSINDQAVNTVIKSDASSNIDELDDRGTGTSLDE